jgi:hypothetical protein
MASLSELWGLEEATLDALILRAPSPPETEGTRPSSTPRIAMGGDRLLAGTCRSATREVELPATPEEVWPWVMQLMRGAGIYGWPALESPDCRSAAHLIADIPLPRLGDQVHRAFILASLEPQREIVWAASEPLRILKQDISGLTINYLIERIDARTTRLIARLRFTAPGMTDATAQRLASALELLLIRSQLSRIRECILKQKQDGDTLNGSNAQRHQHAEFRPAPVKLIAGK